MLKKCEVGSLTLLSIKLTIKLYESKQCGIGERIENRPVGQNTELQYRPTQEYSADLWQRRKGNSMEKELSFRQVVLEKVDIHMQKMNLDSDIILFTKLTQNISVS